MNTQHDTCIDRFLVDGLVQQGSRSRTDVCKQDEILLQRRQALQVRKCFDAVL